MFSVDNRQTMNSQLLIENVNCCQGLGVAVEGVGCVQGYGGIHIYKGEVD
jgi:hypothetical protein